jgi:carboxyl-terminal processing protease
MRFPLSAAWKTLVVVLACVCAFYVTVVRRGGGFGFGITASQPATAQTHRPTLSGRRHAPDPNYDMTAMTVLRFVLMEINNSYVDPARVHPREMLLKGLEAIQRNVAQVLVSHEENQPNVTVRVDTHERAFPVADVNSPWVLQQRWGEILGFLQQHLRGVPDVNLQEVEYAAANGMLRTLDPHSVLLSPEAYHEMQIQTGGHFGGLGIVISIRDGLLTVMNPMPNTPASRAGLRRYDRIMQIDNESTLNMTLQEAVNRLRGEPDSTVNVWITRAGQGGWTTPRRFTLTRAVINVDSVEHRMLAGNVGYAKIKNFSEDTAEELTRALQQMRGQNMRSLVLDLRGNPGGLLEQAVEVADLFLRNGTIVVTAGNRREGRDERQAQERGTEPNYPIVVLIDGGSASASEIVAGALKNNNRALVVGQTSFGKGSVQTIRNLPDGGALKITIAQYLTPGDVSIQGVGITPDIELAPMTVDQLDMDLEPDKAFLRESDLSAHLTSNRAREGGRAAETVQYYLPLEEREALRERGPEDLGDEGWREDFTVRFAREVLTANPRPSRLEELQDARPTIERVRQAELAQVIRALAALPSHVDWSEGPDQGPTQLDVQMQLSRPEAVPGEPFDLTVTVTNRGQHPVYRLRANTKSDNPLFENREFVFGRLNPGETRTWTAPLGLCMVEGHRPGTTTPPPPGARRVCNIPRASLSRVDGVRFEWSEQHGHVPTNVPPMRAQIRGLERPVYAYGWQVADNIQGNGDGRVQRGEHVTMYLTVKNIGRGRGFSTQANLKNLSGQGVLLHAGRFHIDNIQPNGEQQIAFTFEVQPDFRENEIKLELQIEDEDLREFVTQKIHVPLADAGAAVTPATGQWVSPADGALLDAPAHDARPVARAPQGMAFPITAQSGDYVRIDAGRGRPAWVRRAESAGRPGAARNAQLAWVLHNSPPLIESDAGNTLAVRGNTLHVTGNANDQQRVLDLYIFVGARKVFYLSNRNGPNPRQVSFTADLPLRPGSNVVTIVAREDDDTLARRTYVIRRDGPNGELLQTPRQGQDRDEGEE